MDGLARLLLVRVPAHLEPALHHLSVLRLAAEQLDRVGFRADGAVARADRRPYERAVSLLVVPRVVMVGDPQTLEAGLLRLHGLRDQILWPPLLAREEVANLHICSLSRALAVMPWREPS